MKARRGIYAAALSPFGADGRLDRDKLADYCRYLLTDGGLDGVAPLGTTGEGNSIALSERLEVPAALSAAGIEPDRAIIGAGSCALADAVAMTKACLSAGYANVLVLPPFYYKNPTDEGVYGFFASLMDAVGDASLRLYLYHFPRMSSVPISTRVVTRLRDAYGEVVAGLKDSGGDFARSREFVLATGGVDRDFDVYPSSEARLFDGLEAGCAGVISGSANAFGRLMRAALDAGEGDRAAAFERVRAARSAAERFNLIAAMKRVEAWRGGDDGWLRLAPPLSPLDDSAEAELRAELRNFDLPVNDRISRRGTTD